MRIAITYRPQDAGFGGRLTADLERGLSADAVVLAADAPTFDVLVALLARESFAADAQPDRVRRALERALVAGTPIVAVTTGDASAPAPADLPPSLAEVDPVTLSDEYWEASVERVVARIQRVRPVPLARAWRRAADVLLRQRRRVKVGAAVSVVGGVVGILAALGVIPPDPPQRGKVAVSDSATSSVTFDAYLKGADHGPDTPRNPVTDDSEGYVYDVDVTLDDPRSDRYALRWSLREDGGGAPVQDRQDLLGLRFSAERATGAHEVWVPCPPLPSYDDVDYVVVFALVDESQPDMPPLARVQGPPADCMFVEPD